VEAIKAGKDARLHLTIADVHATSRIPVSTLHWICKHKPELLGAQKHGGVWYIDRAKFERYMATSDREESLRHETERPPTATRSRRHEQRCTRSRQRRLEVQLRRETTRCLCDGAARLRRPNLRWTNPDKAGVERRDRKSLGLALRDAKTGRLDPKLVRAAELAVQQFQAKLLVLSHSECDM
jgi:hypothetical protein